MIACGGGGDDSDKDAGGDSTSPDKSSESSGGAADSDFCSPEGSEAIFDGMDFMTATDLKTELALVRESLDSWVDNAPSEIRDDARTAAETMRDLIDLLDEFDYDIFAMVAAGDDPRFAAIQSPAFTEATNNIAAY